MFARSADLKKPFPNTPTPFVVENAITPPQWFANHWKWRMGKDTRISWAHHSQNFWIGCTKISSGCAHCYAETQQDKLYHRVHWGKDQPRIRTKTWGQPSKWDAEAKLFETRYRVFTNSLADFFDEEVSDQWRDEAFMVIKACPNLDWLILTKRVEKAKDYLSKLAGWPYPNVWLGASCENQKALEARYPVLESIPAAITFLSLEPLLGPINLFSVLGAPGKLRWVIVGGESGEGFRRMQPSWAMNIFAQCQTAEIKFFMKQASSLYNESKGDIPNGLWDVKELPKIN